VPSNRRSDQQCVHNVLANPLILRHDPKISAPSFQAESKYLYFRSNYTDDYVQFQPGTVAFCLLTTLHLKPEANVHKCTYTNTIQEPRFQSILKCPVFHMKRLYPSIETGGISVMLVDRRRHIVMPIRSSKINLRALAA
jgi:hypothetical protein